MLKALREIFCFGVAILLIYAILVWIPIQFWIPLMIGCVTLKILMMFKPEKSEQVKR